ncbi:MAG TPA: ABC transporter ATP-binding protein [Myxococcales bacterium]|nr:ABC transporter ATP-binding protein [Myxococcales bacterium]
MLKVSNIQVVYDGAILVLGGLSLSVAEGQIVALLGPNGAGKSTTLKAISGLLRSEGGAVSQGSIEFQGQRIDGLRPEEIVRRGIFQVMEGRRVFEDLTVQENLILGGYTRNDRAALKLDEVRCYDFFPVLGKRRKQLAGTLSGGEQQMLALGRALMARPKLILLDEPSLGVAPLLVEEIFRLLKRICREEKTTLLLVEQNARLALGLADYGYILESGRIVLEGPPDKLGSDEDVKHLYLGGAAQKRLVT